MNNYKFHENNITSNKRKYDKVDSIYEFNCIDEYDWDDVETYDIIKFKKFIDKTYIQDIEYDRTFLCQQYYLTGEMMRYIVETKNLNFTVDDIYTACSHAIHDSLLFYMESIIKGINYENIFESFTTDYFYSKCYKFIEHVISKLDHNWVFKSVRGIEKRLNPDYCSIPDYFEYMKMVINLLDPEQITCDY